MSGGALSDTRAIILDTSIKCVRGQLRTFGTNFAEVDLGDYLLSEDATYRSCRTRLNKWTYMGDFQLKNYFPFYEFLKTRNFTIFRFGIFGRLGRII